jgi:hypothetical protein
MKTIEFLNWSIEVIILLNKYYLIINFQALGVGTGHLDCEQRYHSFFSFFLYYYYLLFLIAVHYNL